MLPSLTSGRRTRLFAFTACYVAQGLPIGLLTVAMPAWIAANGADAGDVANFVAITTLPWAFKLLAGPVMDRFKFPAMGGRRPWVMLAQTGLLLALAALAMSSAGPSDIFFLTWAGFAVNCFAAVQDVAVDGMAIEVLPESERGRANALMAFGQVAGSAGAGALCGWSLGALGLGATAAMMAAGVAAILALVVALRERDGEKLLPWTQGSIQHPDHTVVVGWMAMIRNLLRAMLLPTSLLVMLVVVCWRVADGIFITAVPILATQELGWSSAEYAGWYSNASFVAAVCGIFLGPFIDRRGARSFLVLGLLGLTLVYGALALSTAWWHLGPVWIIGLFTSQLMAQVTVVAAIALHMNICWARIAATQFALYMAWTNLCRALGAKTYGELSPYLEMGQEVWLMAGLALLGALLVLPLRLESHRQRLQALKGEAETADPLADIPARF